MKKVCKFYIQKAKETALTEIVKIIVQRSIKFILDNLVPCIFDVILSIIIQDIINL